MKNKFLKKYLFTGILTSAMIIASGCGSKNTSVDVTAYEHDPAAETEAVVSESSQIKSDQTKSNQTKSAAAAATPAADGEDPADQNLPDGTITAIPEQAGSDGVVFVADNRGFTPYYFAESSGDAYANMMNTIAASLGSSVNTYCLIAPSAYGVCLDDNAQAAMGGSDENDAIEYTYSQMNSSVTPIRVLDKLKKHNAEYLFFGTDHHWTQLGAYYAYRQFCFDTGRTPTELEDHIAVEYPGFLGTFPEHCDYTDVLSANPDTVYGWMPLNTNEAMISDAYGNEVFGAVITDVSGTAAGSKYSSFIGGDNALTTITNPAINDGSACILIKDSFGNAFAPFLVDHYQTVYVIDYRYYINNIPEFAAANNVQDVIVLLNVDGVLESSADEILSLF